MAKQNTKTQAQASARSELAELTDVLKGVRGDLLGIRKDMDALGARMSEIESSGNAGAQAHVETPPFVEKNLGERAQADAGTAQADASDDHHKGNLVHGNVHEGTTVFGWTRKDITHNGQTAKADSAVTHFLDSRGRNSYTLWTDDGKSVRFTKDLAFNKGLVKRVNSPARQLKSEQTESAKTAQAKAVSAFSTREVEFPVGTEVVMKFNSKRNDYVPMAKNESGDWTILPDSVAIENGVIAEAYTQTRRVNVKKTKREIKRTADHVWTHEDKRITPEAEEIEYKPTACMCKANWDCVAVREFGAVNPLKK